MATRRTKLPETAWKDPMVVVPPGAAVVRVLKRRNHDTTPPLRRRWRETATKGTSTVVLRRCYLARWPGASLRVVCVSPSLPPSRPAHPPTPVLLLLQAPLRVLSGPSLFHDFLSVLNALARSSGSPLFLPSRHYHSQSYFCEHSSDDMDCNIVISRHLKLDPDDSIADTFSLSRLRHSRRNHNGVVLIPRNKRRCGIVLRKFV